MKIAYATQWNARNVHEWSGTVYNIANALIKQNADLYYLDKLSAKPALFSKLRNRFYSSIFNKTIRVESDASVLRQNSSEVLSCLQADTDVVFSPSSLQMVFLDTNKLKVFYTDAVFASLVNRIHWMSNLPAFQIRELHKLEKKALERCDLALYASDWAAQGAIEYYQADPGKVKVVPFGANIESFYSAEDIEEIIDLRTTRDVCRLLFVGVEWERKGGDFAVQVAKCLHERKIPVRLDIVGIRQDIPSVPSYVVNHGFISKATPEGFLRLNELMAVAHFFVLPTRFEPYGIVFAEASAYGLPSLAPRTGGVSTVVRDNRNGMTFDLSASPEEYADYIAGLFNDGEAYKRQALSAYEEYVTRLNWDTAGQTIMDLIKDRI